MPPAFVLSQDQTLKTIVSKSLATFKSSFEHFLWLYLRFRISFLSVLSLCNVFKKYNLLKVITGMMSFFIIALFNFQDPLSIPTKFLSFSDLIIISHCFLFVKSFFRFFSNLFYWTLSKLSFVRQLVYNTTLVPICQHFFAKKFPFLQLVFWFVKNTVCKT